MSENQKSGWFSIPSLPVFTKKMPLSLGQVEYHLKQGQCALPPACEGRAEAEWLGFQLAKRMTWTVGTGGWSLILSRSPKPLIECGSLHMEQGAAWANAPHNVGRMTEKGNIASQRSKKGKSSQRDRTLCTQHRSKHFKTPKVSHQDKCNSFSKSTSQRLERKHKTILSNEWRTCEHEIWTDWSNFYIIWTKKIIGDYCSIVYIPLK